MKPEIYNRNVDTRNELLANFLVEDGRIKKRDDQLRRTKPGPGTGFAKRFEDDGGIFVHLW